MDESTEGVSCSSNQHLARCSEIMLKIEPKDIPLSVRSNENDQISSKGIEAQLNNSDENKNLVISLMKLEESLDEFKRLGLDKVLGNPRSRGMSLEQLKSIARLFGISCNLKKAAMANMIQKQIVNTEQLRPLVFPGIKSNGNSAQNSNLSYLRKDRNVFPRLCNILFTYYKD